MQRNKFDFDTLVNRLGMDESKAKLVMEAQEAFPELLLRERKVKLCTVSARKLWEKLQVQKSFAGWISNQIQNLDEYLEEEDYFLVWRKNNKPFKEDIKDPSSTSQKENLQEENDKTFKGFVDEEDFADIYINEDGVISFREDIEKTHSSQLTHSAIRSKVRNGYYLDYMITPTFGIDICVSIGATPRVNQDTKEMSRLVKRYFLLIEEAFVDLHEWEVTRRAEKKTCKDLRQLAFQRFQETECNLSFDNAMAREFNTINVNVTGMTAKQIREYYNIDDKVLLRDFLPTEYNDAIDDVQTLDYWLIRSGLSYDERAKIEARFCEENLQDLPYLG